VKAHPALRTWRPPGQRHGGAGPEPRQVEDHLPGKLAADDYASAGAALAPWPTTPCQRELAEHTGPARTGKNATQLRPVVERLRRLPAVRRWLVKIGPRPGGRRDRHHPRWPTRKAWPGVIAVNTASGQARPGETAGLTQTGRTLARKREDLSRRGPCGPGPRRLLRRLRKPRGPALPLIRPWAGMIRPRRPGSGSQPAASFDSALPPAGSMRVRPLGYRRSWKACNGSSIATAAAESAKRWAVGCPGLAGAPPTRLHANNSNADKAAAQTGLGGPAVGSNWLAGNVRAADGRIFPRRVCLFLRMTPGHPCWRCAARFFKHGSQPVCIGVATAAGAPARTDVRSRQAALGDSDRYLIARNSAFATGPRLIASLPREPAACAWVQWALRRGPRGTRGGPPPDRPPDLPSGLPTRPVYSLASLPFGGADPALPLCSLLVDGSRAFWCWNGSRCLRIALSISKSFRNPPRSLSCEAMRRCWLRRPFGPTNSPP